MKLTKENLFSGLLATFSGCLIISNILAFKVVDFFGMTLPAAVILFPVVYIVNDMMAELYDFKRVRRGIFFGFGLNLLAVLAYSVAIILPSPSFFTGGEAFALVLGNSARMLIASFSAYLAGSILNAWIMVKMRNTGSNKLMLRCILSTLAGETVDASVFITIAFIGTMSVTSLIQTIALQAAFKTIYEIVCFPATKLLIGRVKKLG